MNTTTNTIAMLRKAADAIEGSNIPKFRGDYLKALIQQLEQAAKEEWNLAIDEENREADLLNILKNWID